MGQIMIRFLKLLFFAFLSGTACAGEPYDITKEIDGKYINRTIYEKWRTDVPIRQHHTPDFIKNRTQIGFNLGGEEIPASVYYPFLQYVADSAKKNGEIKPLAFEMAEWIDSDMFGRRLSASIVIKLLFPSLKDHLYGSMVDITEARKKDISSRVRAICEKMQ
jgi:hypothetical protein